jgi:hypothetical protein
MGLAPPVGVTTTTSRHLGSLFANGSRHRSVAQSFLFTAVIGMSMFGCDTSNPVSGELETGEETSSSEPDIMEPEMDEEPLPDLGGGDEGEGEGGGSGGDGDGDGDGGAVNPDEPDVCGDGIVGPTEECDVAIYALIACDVGPGAYVCGSDCTLDEGYCGCELGTEGCLCNTADMCDAGLECAFGVGAHLCRPTPPACIEPLEPCSAAVNSCCAGSSCGPDSAGNMICQ